MTLTPSELTPEMLQALESVAAYLVIIFGLPCLAALTGALIKLVSLIID